jgi:hypothetical protein
VTGTQGAVGAVLVVLALGLALRLIIAYLLPGSGFGVDLNAFRAWAINLASEGLHGFYDRDFFHDYTPGYLYVLWLVGMVGSVLGDVSVGLIKVPAILADLAIGWLVWSMITELGGRRSLALGAAFVAVVNPISWFDSVVWGQVDSVGVVFLLLGLREIWRDHPERAAIYAIIAALIKPQLGILIPILAVVTIRRAFWPPDDPADLDLDDALPPPPSGPLDRFRGWERRTDRPIRVLTTGIVAAATTVLLCLPFGLSVLEFSDQAPFFKSGLLSQIFATASGYPYLTVNAFNPWALVSGDTGNSLANSHLWVCDGSWGPTICGSGVATFGPVPAVLVGGLLMLAVTVLVSLIAAWHPDRLTILVSLTVLAIAFYVVPTRVHERYAYPVFALAIMLAAIAWRWRIAYAVLSITVFLNMYWALTLPFYANPGISDWLGIESAIGSEAGIAVLALLNGAVFVWSVSQLRVRARDRLAGEMAAAGPIDEPGPSAWVPVGAGLSEGAAAGGGAGLGAAASELPASRLAVAGPPPTGVAAPAVAAAAVTLPTWTSRPTFEQLGLVGWFRERLNEPPIRPDRSATIRNEGGGRLDRLDLWLVVVLIIGTMLLRTFRLDQPLQMHFDEVYHARTATEFLQDWRYGISHDIYEWTHPHLAKYLMAAGIVLWGQDNVSATSDLGVPVVAATVEPLRTDETALSGEAGGRLHVATGTEIRTYDLVTRDLISVVGAPGSSALAIDKTGNQLVIGYRDGRLATLDLDLIGDGGVNSGLEPTALATVDHAVEHLMVTDDGAQVVATSAARLTSVDLSTGTVIGSLDLAGIADLAPGGSGDALVANVDDVSDPKAVASSLAAILATNAAAIESQFAGASPGSTVNLGVPGSGDTRTKLDKAIAAGTLPGISVDPVPRVAVATSTGVAFVDPRSAKLITTIKLAGGAHGLALTSGLDAPKLYATAGPPDIPKYDVIAVGGPSAQNVPTDQAPGLGLQPLPGPGTWVAYDDASQMVHILGLAPGAGPAGPWTVYVVEPHGNAVFTDARLPDGFVPSAWGTDFNAQYPSQDRQQLLLFDAAGGSAAIDTGSHAFAWRLPGVIAGAITAALLYLLTRILFRRRLVAGLVGLFVIADGMFFVQSRIGMNDIYVGTFIIAAYTVFAAVWTGWWKGRAAFWIAMPVVGVLLGLALASKWVAAYAIGALLLLILVRSALGRVLAIIGLIGITTVLGYMAISVPPAQAGGDPGLGNLTFYVIMIALTLLAVVVAVVHPVAWTDDEMYIAIGAPVALGALVFFVALGTGRLDKTITIGSLALTPLLLALLLAVGSLVVVGLFWLGGKAGFGPLAPPPGPGDPIRQLEPPGAPAEGWLRPGWGFGIPVVWVLACIVALPVGVYIVSYIPWAFVENHQLFPGWPPGHTGQTLLDLTGQMYAYHNGLSDAHPASSPWWAWPMNLKPVWFYQQGLAGGTSAALYDAGSLVIWWMGIPALAFISWMAFKRRSPALTIIAVGFAAQWIPWARIDRAAFQYHYYTALPFVVMALAYLAAELWHGASRHTWQLARIAGAIAIMGPAILWILDRPLCAFVGVDRINPGSQACPAVVPDFVLTARIAVLAIVLCAGLVVIVRSFLTLQSDEGSDDRRGLASPAFLRLAATGVLFVVGLIVVGAVLPDTTILTLTNLPVEPIALALAIPLGYFALQVFSSRDARRFVVGLVVAAVGWFAILYPNISALPLPNAVVAAYQGILPTYLYAFQFPVSTVTRNTNTPIFTPMLGLLLVALIVTCLVVAYSAWVWRLARAEAAAAAGGTSDDAEGLARTGGA